MDYFDEIQLEYNNFLAEQELFENLIALGSSVYHEEAGLMLVEEDFKNTINEYIDKIVTGIQDAWNTFKEKVIDAAVGGIIKNARNKLADYDGTTEVEYWHVYDFTKLDSINLPDFNLEALQDVDSKQEYYSKAFGSLISNKEKSLKQNIIDQVISTQDKHVISVEEMEEMITFCETGFKTKTTKLEQDLKKMNANISKLRYSMKVTEPGEMETETVPQETNVTTAKSESVEMLSSLYESYSLVSGILHEVETTADKNKENKDTKSTKVVDAGEEKAKNIEKNSIKRISWYLGGNTDIISAKMKILRQKYLDSIKIFKAVFPKEKEEEKKKETKKTTQKKEQKTQIEINNK
jgi:hypothetical protein